jgi:hypothetical protein
MRTRVTIAAALGLLLGLAPSGAQAKGARGADIGGPGIERPIRLGGNAVSGNRLGALAEASGFFTQVYGHEPNALLEGPPEVELGPRYSVRYAMEPGGQGGVTQHVYPFAPGGPVTFMAAGQRFWGTETTAGGWIRALPGLRQTLTDIGVPKSPPARPATDVAGTGQARSVEASPGPFAGAWPWVLLASAAGLAGTGMLISRRREPGGRRAGWS